MYQSTHLKQKHIRTSVHSWSHHDGALAILKVWSDNMRDTAPSIIVKQSRRGLLRSALLRNYSIPVWVQDGARFGENGIDLSFDEILVRVVKLRHAYKTLVQHRDLEVELVETLNNEARDLDKASRMWEAELPQKWTYTTHSIPGAWPRTGLYSLILYTYSRRCYAAVWLQYFAVRMLVMDTLLSLLHITCAKDPSVRNSSHQQELLKCRTQLKLIIDGLASTIPFSLGRINLGMTNDKNSMLAPTLNSDESIPPHLAIHAVWPLAVALNLDGVELEMRQWFRGTLVRLGSVLGDGSLECAVSNGELTRN